MIDDEDNLSRSTALFILAGILIVAYVSRIVFANAAYYPTFDTATPKLMALDILQGNSYPLFFYGQKYFGALEAYAGAAMMKLMGPTIIAMVVTVSLFTLLWIWSTYLLFAELFNRQAGLVAAAILAIPGYQLAWYTVASYGGYPVAFWAGTTVLWLALRIQKHMPEGRLLWLHCLGMGVFIAIGLWTHYMVAPYLLVAAGLLLFHLNRSTILPYIAAGLIGAFGFVPGLFVRHTFASSGVSEFVFKGEHLAESLGILFKKNIPLMAFWNPTGLFDITATPIVQVIGLILLIFALGFFVLSVIRKRSVYLLVPLAFLLTFLAFYLPHDMATVKAPRYIFPFWTILACTLFAFPFALGDERPARLALIPLIGFLVFQAVGQVAYARKRVPQVEDNRAWAEQSIADARELDCHSVFMVGDPIFGHKGQILSFLSGNYPIFASSFDERRGAFTSRLFANLLDAGYLCQPGIEHKVAESFRVMQHPFKREGSMFIADYNTDLGKAVRGEAPAELFDRIFETRMTGQYGRDDIVIEMPQSCELSGIWMTDIDTYQIGLPESYDLAISNDGQTWKTILECRNRIAVSSAYNGVRFKGFMNLQETRFDPVEAKWLKIIPLRGQGGRSEWSVNEVLVFEVSPGPMSPPQGLDPNYNPKFTAMSGSTKVTTYQLQHYGFEVRQELADETQFVLERVYGTDAVSKNSSFIGSVTFDIQPSDVTSPLMWNGHFLLESADPHRPWH